VCGDTRGTVGQGYGRDLGQTSVAGDAIANDLIEAGKQDIHEVVVVADGVVEWRAACANDGGLHQTQRTIATLSGIFIAPSGPASNVALNLAANLGAVLLMIAIGAVGLQLWAGQAADQSQLRASLAV
jgi:hypothetical protein